MENQCRIYNAPLKIPKIKLQTVSSIKFRILAGFDSYSFVNNLFIENFLFEKKYKFAFTHKNAKDIKGRVLKV